MTRNPHFPLLLPGLVGQIEAFILAQAPRPVSMLARVGALALVAGIAGRAYNVSGAGLNVMLVFLAQSGTGKEAPSRGMSKIMRAVSETTPNANYPIGHIPAASEFFFTGEFGSSQALHKRVVKCPSFVHVVGEAGLALKIMSSDKAPPQQVAFLRFMLDVYGKSGHGGQLDPIEYSDKEKNTGRVLEPAYTYCGESTPEEYYKSITEAAVVNGFVPRLSVFEYLGEAAPLNPSHATAQPSPELIEGVANLCELSLKGNKRINEGGMPTGVEIAPDEGTGLAWFEGYCERQKIGQRDVIRRIWTRTYLKAAKLAAIVAVGVNPERPVITPEIAAWAVWAENETTQQLIARFESGDVGGKENEQTRQDNDLVRSIAKYVERQYSELPNKGYVTIAEHAERVIPMRWLQQGVGRLASFKHDGKENEHLNRTIKRFIDAGDLRELSKAELAEKFNKSGRAFVVSNPARFFGGNPPNFFGIR